MSLHSITVNTLHDYSKVHIHVLIICRMSDNKLDFKNFKWSRHDYSSAKWDLGGIQEDSKVAKKMVMCFHFVKGWRF